MARFGSFVGVPAAESLEPVAQASVEHGASRSLRNFGIGYASEKEAVGFQAKGPGRGPNAEYLIPKRVS